MSLNLSAVVVASSKLNGCSFTDAEREIAKKVVTEVIGKLGGRPVNAEGKDAFGQYVPAIKAACIEAGSVPAGDKYKNGRSWASYAFLAKQAIKGLVAASEKKGKKTA